MDQSVKDRVRKWLNSWIDITHELYGISQGTARCTIAIPGDIAMQLCNAGIIEQKQDYYRYQAGEYWIDVNPTIGNQVSISILR